RDELGDGIVETEFARLDELHRGDSNDGLRHRIHTEDAVSAHGNLRGNIHTADSLGVPDLAVARDEHDEAGELPRIDVRFESRRDARERLWCKADVLRPS